MKTNYCMIFVLASLLLTFSACGSTEKKPVPESLVGIKETVARLNSMVTSMYGSEPKDSTYDCSVDTMSSYLMDVYEQTHPNEPEQKRTEHAIDQEAFDQAKITWNKFKHFIDEDQYEEALDFCLGNEDKMMKKRTGDFIIFLRHSTLRFEFFSQVLRPMMIEYRGLDFATEEYISYLHFEKANCDVIISLLTEFTDYFPEVYPNIITELGTALVSVGKIDEAMKMCGDLSNAIVLITGDVHYANFCVAGYAANLYVKDDQPDLALAIWDGYERDYLEGQKSYYEPEELNRYIRCVEAERSKIQFE